MKPIAIKELAEAINGEVRISEDTVKSTGVAIDSRTIQPGEIFFAIRGDNFDGHDFVAPALERGACIAVVEGDIPLHESFNNSIVRVDNTVTALGRFAAWYRRQISAKVIAITGSVGKTTTRHILYEILSRHFRCRQARNSFNNHIGVPLTILAAEPDDEILLVEMGSNSPGEIEKLSTVARPDIALITLVAPAHLEGFGSIENIIVEKSAIAKGLSSEGTLFMNGDQPDLVNFVRSHYSVKKQTFGTSAACDIRGGQLKTEGGRGSFAIDGHMINVPLAGMASVQNCLAAWAVCRHLGLELQDFEKAVGLLKPYSMRLTQEQFGSVTVLNDCYNANPASMVNALKCLNTLNPKNSGRRVFISGCMAEMGSHSESLHVQLGRDAAFNGVEILLAAGPFAPQIAQGVYEADKQPVAVQDYENTDKLCDNLHKWIQPDDIILVKGSRAARLEKAVERIKELFEE